MIPRSAARSIAVVGLLLGLGTGGFAQGAPGVPRLHPNDPHRLTMGGSTWYPVGYYPSLGALTTDQNDYTTYYRSLIDKLAANGIDYFRTVFTFGQPYGNAIVPYLRTGPGLANDGRPKFDLTRFDQSYFDYWRNVVLYAQSKGVVVQLCLVDGWHTHQLVVEDDGFQQVWGLQYDFYYGANNVNGVNATDDGLWLDPSGPAADSQRAMFRKIVDTVGDLPNIVWEIGNETGRTSWEVTYADYVNSYEQSKGFATHLAMPRDLPGHQYVPSFGGNTGNDPVSTHDGLVSAFGQNLVLISDNDGAQDVDADTRRRKAWGCLTAGAQIDYFHFDMYQQAVLDSQDAADGMRYVGYLRKFLSDLGVNLVGMQPSDGLVSQGWCYARSGDEYVIYLPSGGSTTVSGLPPAYSAAWFNPRDGSVQSAGGGPTFSAPDGNDWALRIVGTGNSSALPDVVVTSLAYSGGIFSCTVRNQGSASTPPGVLIGVGYFVDGVQQTWGAVSGPLAAGASVTIGTDGGSYTIPDGTHTIMAYVDDVDRFAESDEGNNTYSQTIGVGSGGGTAGIAINSGGGAVGGYGADAYYSGGSTYSTSASISTGGVINPAPQAVYQSERWGEFTYTVPGLVAGARYMVVLHFAEIYWTSAGQRLFNVSLNGTRVLSDFDIFAAAGGSFRAIVREFRATADGSGRITIEYSAGSADLPKSSGILVSRIAAAVNCGGGAAGAFGADNFFAGGISYITSTPVSTAGVTAAAPQAVYQAERWGDFTYSFTGLATTPAYTVRLHFAEIYWTGPGQRLFNVSINGTPVLSNFDIYAQAGGNFKALVREFPARADSSGRIVVQFSTVVDAAKCSGIEIFDPPSEESLSASNASGSGGSGACGATGMETLLVLGILAGRRRRRRLRQP